MKHFAWSVLGECFKQTRSKTEPRTRTRTPKDTNRLLHASSDSSERARRCDARYAEAEVDPWIIHFDETGHSCSQLNERIYCLQCGWERFEC